MAWVGNSGEGLGILRSIGSAVETARGGRSRERPRRRDARRVAGEGAAGTGSPRRGLRPSRRAQRDPTPGAFRDDGGLPPEARPAGAGERDGAPHREIGANRTDSQREADQTGQRGRDGDSAFEGAERGFGAPWKGPESEEGLPVYNGLTASGKPRPDETCWVRLVASAEVVRLFRAVLCTVRRRIEADTGWLPTAGEALDAMLDHAFAAWGADQAKVPARHRVFARDGWRRAVPGCSSTAAEAPPGWAARTCTTTTSASASPAARTRRRTA